MLLLVTLITGGTIDNVMAAERGMHCNNAEALLDNVSVRDLTREEKQLVKKGDIKLVEVEDLNSYLKNIECGRYSITDRIEERPVFKCTDGLSDVSSQFIAFDPMPVPPVRINCQFTYSSKKNSKGHYYFTSISKIKSWLTGVQFPAGYTWSQKNSSYSFSNGKKNVTITVSGVMGCYVAVKGVGKVIDMNCSYSFDFTARK